MVGWGRCAAPGPRLTRPGMRNWQSRASPCRRRPTARSCKTSSSTSSTRRSRARQGRPARRWLPRFIGREIEMLGKLTWSAIPFNEPLPLLSGAVVGLVILALLVTVTVKGWWPYLWREWLTSVDHKRIGVMYVVLGLVMLLRGFSDAIMMRTQQAIAVGASQGYLPPEHYDQVFSAHGTI